MIEQNHEYAYSTAEGPWLNYLWASLTPWITAVDSADRRVFELGCGNGATAGMLGSLGFKVTAVDPSISGITIAKASHLNAAFETASTHDDLAARFGTFPLLVSLEVVEHCYAPREFAKSVFNLLEPGGKAFISTPYHGYLKNLVLAITGKLDAHFTALWDGGHIKFWSMKTLNTLLTEVGFEQVEFRRVGRISPLAKSMVAIVTKPK